MKSSERKISQCILPFSNVAQNMTNQFLEGLEFQMTDKRLITLIIEITRNLY